MAGQRIDRTERLLNLVFALMGSEQPVSRASIAASIPGYDPTAGQSAFERMFERDKDELRGLGIPIRTVLDVNGDVAGYTIDRDDYALPEVHFTAAERSVLVLAATAWQDALLRSSAISGLRKLEADGAGITADLDETVTGFVAHINAGDAPLLRLLGALRERQSVRFGYRAPRADSNQERYVDPWGVVAQDGGWYLVGHDRDRNATRAFRLSRMLTEPILVGPIDTPAPPQIDLRSHIDPASRASESVTARVRLQAGAGAAVRRLSDDRGVHEAVVTARAIDGATLVSATLIAGDGAELLEPVELRAEVHDALARIREMHAGTPS